MFGDGDVCRLGFTRASRKVHGKQIYFWCRAILKSMHGLFTGHIFYELFKGHAYELARVILFSLDVSF